MDNSRWSVLQCWIFWIERSAIGNRVILAIEDRALILRDVSDGMCDAAEHLRRGKQYVAVKTDGVHLSLFGEAVESYRSCHLRVRRDGSVSVVDGSSGYGGWIYEPPASEEPKEWKTKRCCNCDMRILHEVENKSSGIYFPCSKSPKTDADIGLHDWVYDEGAEKLFGG
jgi:hypothetical protein